MPRLYPLLLSLLIASSVSAVTMDWTFIGDPGNTCQTLANGCFGAVGYEYNIGTYEVTNAQYAEFLNAKAASDTLGLYNTNMGSSIYGGITRTGSPGSYSYGAIAGRGDMPVNYVSFYEAVRFANWMNNGQGNADTETGAYRVVRNSPNFAVFDRSPSATIFLPSEDEWFKAAYYIAPTASYFSYATGSNTEPTCTGPTAVTNSANCIGAVGNLTIRGSYTGSPSPYGTFDQGGNVFEWNEEESGPGFGSRGVRAGAYAHHPGYIHAATQVFYAEYIEASSIGFRLAMIPEPGTSVLVAAGLLGFAGWRRRHC